MSRFLEYLSTLLHIIGIVLLAGGHIWFGLVLALAERRGDREGVRFLATTLPLMANAFGIGVLLLFGSGVLKLLLWGEPGSGKSMLALKFAWRAQGAFDAVVFQHCGQRSATEIGSPSRVARLPVRATISWLPG